MKKQVIQPIMAEEVDAFFCRAMKKAFPEIMIQRIYNLEDEENLAHTGMDVVLNGQTYMVILSYKPFKRMPVAHVSMTSFGQGSDIEFNIDPFTLRNDLGNDKKKEVFEENLRLNLMDEEHPPRSLKGIVGSYYRALNSKRKGGRR